MQTFEPPGYVTFIQAAERVLKVLGAPNDRPYSAMMFLRRAAHCGAPPTYFLDDHGRAPEPMEPGKWRDDRFYREASCGRKVFWLPPGAPGPWASEGRAFFRSVDVDKLIAWARSQRDPLQITAPLDWKAVQEATAASTGSGTLIEGDASPVSLDNEPEAWLAAGDDASIEAALERALAGGGADEPPELPRAEYLSEPEILREWNTPAALFDTSRGEILHAATTRKLPMCVKENGVLRPATKGDLACLSAQSPTARLPARFRFERSGLCKLPSLGLPPDEAKRRLDDVNDAVNGKVRAQAPATGDTLAVVGPAEIVPAPAVEASAHGSDDSDQEAIDEACRKVAPDGWHAFEAKHRGNWETNQEFDGLGRNSNSGRSLRQAFMDLVWHALPPDVKHRVKEKYLVSRLSDAWRARARRLGKQSLSA